MRGIVVVVPSAVVTVMVFVGLEIVGMWTREVNEGDIMSCVQPPSMRISALWPQIIAVTRNKYIMLFDKA